MKTNKINVVLSLNKTVVSTYTGNDNGEDTPMGCANINASPTIFKNDKYARYTAQTGTTGTGAGTTGGLSATSGCCP